MWHVSGYGPKATELETQVQIFAKNSIGRFTRNDTGKNGEENIAKYNPQDLTVLLEKWCTKENKVGHVL
jgi:hypothetical protein